jgi:hypothetical protein
MSRVTTSIDKNRRPQRCPRISFYPRPKFNGLLGLSEKPFFTRIHLFEQRLQRFDADIG